MRDLNQKSARTGGSEHAPQCVLLAPYLVMRWLYEPIVPTMRERFGTRFLVQIPETSDLESQYRAIVDDADKFVPITSFSEMAKRRSAAGDAVSEYAIAKRNEEIYGVSYVRDIVQQERALGQGYIAGAREHPFVGRNATSQYQIIAAINGFFEHYEAVFDEYPIDLVLMWPRSGAEAVCVYVAARRGVLVSYPYTAKYKHFAYWATGAFCAGLQHERAYEAATPRDPIPETEITPPGRPADLQQALIDDRYSTAGTVKEVSRALLHHAEFALIDLKRMRRGERVGLRKTVYKHLSNWHYYRRFMRLCERDLSRLQTQPYLFFAFQAEPEFSVQARCKEFNDQRSLVRHIAQCLPCHMRLVIKEHAWIGDRKLDFYRELVELPNVIMAHPGIRAIDLIPGAEAVASLAGTVTLEAALFGKAALIFSGRSEFTVLPSVKLVEKTSNLAQVIADVVRPPDAQVRHHWRAAAARLCSAIESISIQADHFYTKSGEPLPQDSVERAVDLLLALISLHARERHVYGPFLDGSLVQPDETADWGTLTQALR